MSSLVLNTEKIFPEFSQPINFVPSSRVFSGNGDSISDINPFQLAAGVFGVTVAGGISNAFTKNSLSKLFSSGITSLAAQGGARAFQAMPLSPLGKLGLLLAGGAVFHVVHRAYNYAVMGQQWQGLPNELLSGISTVVMFAGAAGVMSLATPKITGLALSEPAKRFALLATEYAFFSAYEPLEAGVLSVFNGGNFKEAAAHSFTAKAFVERAAFMAGCKAAHPVSARFERATTHVIESVKNNPLQWAAGATAVTTAIAAGAHPLHVLGASILFPSLTRPSTSQAQKTLRFLKKKYPNESILVEVNPTNGNAYYKLASAPHDVHTHQGRPVPEGSGNVSYSGTGCGVIGTSRATFKRERMPIPNREIYFTDAKREGYQLLGKFVDGVRGVHIKYEARGPLDTVKNLVIHGGDSLHTFIFVNGQIGIRQSCYTVYTKTGLGIYFRKEDLGPLTFGPGGGPIEVGKAREIQVGRVNIETAKNLFLDEDGMLCEGAKNIAYNDGSNLTHIVHTLNASPENVAALFRGRYLTRLLPRPPSQLKNIIDIMHEALETPTDRRTYDVSLEGSDLKVSVQKRMKTPPSGIREFLIRLVH